MGIVIFSRENVQSILQAFHAHQDLSMLRGFNFLQSQVCDGQQQDAPSGFGQE
jgi:hypothetical protein